MYGYIGKHGQGKGREVVDPNPSLFGIHIDIGTGRDKAGYVYVCGCVVGHEMKDLHARNFALDSAIIADGWEIDGGGDMEGGIPASPASFPPIHSLRPHSLRSPGGR